MGGDADDNPAAAATAMGRDTVTDDDPGALAAGLAPAGRFVLVVDQFEEIFTHCADVEARTDSSGCCSPWPRAGSWCSACAPTSTRTAPASAISATAGRQPGCGRPAGRR